MHLLQELFQKGFSTIIKTIFSARKGDAPSVADNARSFLDHFTKCSDVRRALASLKCNEIDRSIVAVDAAKTCKNGGGNGENWLWADEIDVRQDPASWTAQVPDRSTCCQSKGVHTFSPVL